MTTTTPSRFRRAAVALVAALVAMAGVIVLPQALRAASIFALLIALTGTYRGLQVRDSSRELGRLTTTAVVQSIFLVLLADALFAVAFWLLDI